MNHPTSLKRSLLIIAGVLSVVLGVIGVFVPLLPTVPFLLLAAYCFARSSEKFYNWLYTNRWSGPILKNYQEGKGIPLHLKISSLLLFWIVVGYSLVWVIESYPGKIIMAVVGVAVTIHLLMLKSYRTSDVNRRPPVLEDEEAD